MINITDLISIIIISCKGYVHYDLFILSLKACIGKQYYISYGYHI